MRWMGHAACLGRNEVHTEFWWGNLGESDQLKDLGMYGRILKLIFKKCYGRSWIGLS
jgi:hypothetical protein